MNMDINSIKNYERNARHNEKAIPAVAKSIEEFGFRGQILLESRDNPVIVTGHTRVADCKMLGWTEIPDEHIAYCDGLTPDQIKAFRIADNKTGDIATYNISMLKSEIKSIKELDMSKFGCDFKSKNLSYGAERLKTDRAYNLHLVNRDFCNGSGMPEIFGETSTTITEMVGFNYVKSMKPEDKHGKACHFFIDDYQFERLWTSPEQYVQYLKGFECVLTPDFSLYLDMPDAMQRWNRYRSQALGAYWQSLGITVIPTLSWAQPETYKFAFDGVPKHSIVATSTVGIKADKEATELFKQGLRAALNIVQPSELWLYGNQIDFDFGNLPVKYFKNSVTERMAGHNGW